MLPAPNTNRSRSKSLPTTSYIVRKIKTNRQLAIVLSVLSLIILYKISWSSSSSLELEAAQAGYTYDPVVPGSDKDSMPLGLTDPNVIGSKKTLPPLNRKGSANEIPVIPARALREKKLEQLLALEKENLFRGKQGLLNSQKSDCPEYSQYSSTIHSPLSKGYYELAFQRPSEKCRTFSAESVEETINEMNKRITDPDLARLFENCFPNTLDTTVLWHHNGTDPQSFIVTGDINALWLRDAHKQVQIYSPLASVDPKIKNLILGLINTQSDFVLSNPYCNAFQPPHQSGIDFKFNNENDAVYPRPNLNVVFECKYEIDSLASFLAIGNLYYKDTGDSSFITPSWLNALSRLLQVLKEQATPTFGPTGRKLPHYYAFRRNTNTGTETLNLGGAGNPVNGGTSLIRSAFRPSDDATIFQYFIPGNAFMSVELRRTARLLEKANQPDLAKQLQKLGEEIENGIYKHGTYQHPVFGKVFAYEVDGFGSVSIMDDANTPSLLSLPDMGFVSQNDEIYLNTRRMILSKDGNPYYLKGQFFEGIGGPHIGTRFAWPMSHIVAMRTTDNDTEIIRSLELLKGSTAGLGLMHESVNVDLPHSFTRSWFAWCNSEFAKTILDLAQRKPHLIFEKDAAPYVIGGGSVQNDKNNLDIKPPKRSDKPQSLDGSVEESSAGTEKPGQVKNTQGGKQNAGAPPNKDLSGKNAELDNKDTKLVKELGDEEKTAAGTESLPKKDASNDKAEKTVPKEKSVKIADKEKGSGLDKPDSKHEEATVTDVKDVKKLEKKETADLEQASKLDKETKSDQTKDLDQEKKPDQTKKSDKEVNPGQPEKAEETKKLDKKEPVEDEDLIDV